MFQFPTAEILWLDGRGQKEDLTCISNSYGLRVDIEHKSIQTLLQNNTLSSSELCVRQLIPDKVSVAKAVFRLLLCFLIFQLYLIDIVLDNGKS